MSSIHALVAGQLFADAELRTSSGGKPFARCSLVLRDGDASTWVRLVAFGSLADELGKLRKGDAVSASGRLKASAYLNKAGEPAAGLELVVDRVLPLAAPPAKQRSTAKPPRFQNVPTSEHSARRAQAPAPAPAGDLAEWVNDL